MILIHEGECLFVLGISWLLSFPASLLYDIVNISMGSSPEVALRDYSGHYNGLRLLELEEDRALGRQSERERDGRAR